MCFLPKVKIGNTRACIFCESTKECSTIKQDFYKRIDQVITLTQNDKVQFDKFHSNVLVIPNFSPFSIASQPQNNNKQIVTIGRLTDQKNYIHLLQAWEKIYQSIPDWQLNIYGEGEHKEMLQNYISQHFLKM